MTNVDDIIDLCSKDDVEGLMLLKVDDWNISNSKGYTPLLTAIYNKSINVLEYLLLDDRCDVNYQTPTHNTNALHIACYTKQEEIARMLLPLIQNINDRDIYLKTCLHHASYKNHFPLVQLLVSHGACPNMMDVYSNKPSDLTTSSEIKNYLLSLE